MGETLKAKLDAKLGRDKDAQIPIEPEVNFDSYADKLLERISRDEILDIHDLLLLPEDHASDLSKRYQNDIKIDTDNYSTPLIIRSQHDRERAKRRIIRSLSKEKTEVDLTESLNVLAKLYAKLKKDQRNSELSNLDPIEGARRRDIRKRNLSENRHKLESEFENVSDKIDQFEEEGSMDYDDAWLFFSQQNKHVQQLDWTDFFKRDHPSRSFREEIPFYGAVHGITKLGILSDKIEALDRASIQDLQKPEYVEYIRDVALFLDSIEADKSVGYKLLESFSAMGDYIFTRGAGKLSQNAAFKVLGKVFPRIKNAMKTATSSGFKNKLSAATKKTGKAVAEESILAVNPLGRGFSTWEQVNEHRIRGQELIGLEMGDIDGKTYVKYLNFKEPKATLDAVTSAVGNEVIEGLTERLGGVFDFFIPSKDKKGILGQIFNGALFKSLKKKNPDVDSGTLLQFMEAANINGIIPEIFEERVSSITVGALGVDQPGMEIKPGFKLFNQDTKKWETEFSELVIPSAEDFGIEGATIATFGGVSRHLQNRAQGSLAPLKMQDEGPVVKGSDPFVRDFVDAGTTSTGSPRSIKVVDTIIARTNKILESKGLKPIRYRRKGKVSPQYMRKVKERGVESLLPDLIEWWTNPSNQEMVEHASTWYGDRFEQTINLLADGDFPELHNKDDRSFFTFLVGITSPNQAPDQNLRFAINEFMIDKGYPTDTKTSESVTKQIGIFKTIAKHKGGYTAAMDFLSKRMTGKELRRELFIMGIGDFTLNNKGEITGALGNQMTLDEEIYGAEIFGPKVGAFTLNLAGVSDIPTVDLWILRSISIHLGDPFDNKTLAQVNYALQRAKDKGPTKTDWAAGLNLERVDFKDNGNRKRIKIYREVVKEVQKEFNKQTGENYTVADIQALIWYMEKSIFESAGTVGSSVSMSDYLTIAETIVNSGEVFNERTQRRVRTTKQLEAEQRAEEALSRDSETTGEEDVPEEDGDRKSIWDTTEEADSKEPDGTGSSGDDDTESAEEAPKKRPGVTTKQVPQVAELDNTQAPSFHQNLDQHKAQHEGGYLVDLKDLEKYEKPYTEQNGYTTVTPTLIMSEDGLSGAALLYKEHGDGTTEVDIVSVYSGEHTDISGTEVMRSAIRKAQRMGADRIILDAYDSHIPTWYESFGFVEYKRDKWDDEKAPSDWQYETHKRDYPNTDGRPDIVYMVLDPKKAREDKDSVYNNVLGLENGIEYKETSVLGSVTRYINNRLDPLKRLKDQLEKQMGKLRNHEDFWSQVRRSYNIAIGKFNAVIEWADDFIARMEKDGISVEMLDRYMHAKHAKERNVLVRMRNKLVEWGAGYNNKGELMTDEKADEIIKEFEGSVIDDYAKEFRQNIILRNIQVRLQGGLLTEDQARIYSGDAPIAEGKDPKDNVSFRNYVPLNIELEDDGQVGGIFKNVSGVKGHSLSGPESKRIKGTDMDVKRKSIFEMGMQNLLMGMTRAESNQVNLKLLNVLRAVDVYVNRNGKKVPLFEFEEVDREDRKNYDSYGNPKYIYASQLEDNQILMKESGVEYIVTINSPEMVKAFQNTSVFGQNPIVQFANAVNNFRKQFITTYSPTFFIGNVQSDLQTGITNLGIEKGSEIAKSAIKFLPKANITIAQYNFNKPNERPDSEEMRYYEEMIAYGGKISFFDFEGFVGKYKDIGKRMEAMGNKAQSKNIFQLAGDYMKSANEVFEGQMRFATYLAMRKNGHSPSASAIAARDVTLDFNKSGEMGQLMEALYMFSKVGVNNIYRMGEVIKSNPAKATEIASWYMLGGFLLSEMARNHDPEEEEKLSDWSKDHYFQIPNFLFTNSDGDKRGFIPVRMAYGWGMFAGLGSMISDYKHEQSKLLEGEEMADGYWFTRGFDIMFSNFSPASGVPTLPGQISSDLIRNKDAIGRTIKPYKFDSSISDFELQFSKTPAYLRDIAYVLANAPLPGNPGLTPNGDVDKYGRISYNDGGPLDFSPSELDYFFGQFLGGVWTTFNNTIGMLDDRNDPNTFNKIIKKAYEGLDPQKTPLVRKIWSYKPTLDVRQARFRNAVKNSEKRLLNMWEVTSAENAIKHLYIDGAISLNEYNKIFDDILENQAKILNTPKQLVKAVKELATKEYKQPKLPSGVRRLNKKKTEKARVGLSDALKAMKGEIEKRTKDN